MSGRAIPAAVAVLAMTACQTAGAGQRTEGAELWTEEVELRLDEMFVADGREIEVLPVRVEINRAVLQVRSGGITQRIELISGPLSSRRLGNYRIELISTTIQPSVNLRISRIR